MRLLKIFIAAVALFAACDCYSQKSELKPYIDFLEGQNTSAVDYIFGLFEKHDIVVLCERDHRDISQYDFIKEIISDRRFITSVGHIFTEAGACNLSERANAILKGDYEDFSAFEEDLMKLYRDLTDVPIWEKYSMYDLLSTIYWNNTRLRESSKVDIHFTDMEFDWNNFVDIDSLLDPLPWGYRDSIMGDNFIKAYDRIVSDPSQSRKKALVIQNSRHAFQDSENISKIVCRSMAAHLFDKYPGRVANVMINSQNHTDIVDSDYFLIDHGKWDAAFMYFDNPRIGFDMEGSPFGETDFDYYPDLDLDYYPPTKKSAVKGDIKFKDVFTGFVFYKPLSEWVLMFGIPGFVDKEFKPEYIRRNELYSGKKLSEESLKARIQQANKLRIIDVFEDDAHRKKVDEWINQWLRDND